MVDWRHRTALAVLCLQLLLAQHTYRSTDFEVHRNWLAITHQLPISRWYYEATSEWTLDYPPLFAWMEWAMSHVAKYVDPKMLVVGNMDYDSLATVMFQRLSVCVTSLVLVAAMLHATKDDKDGRTGLTAFVLVVANAGLIIVDNIHFQYNSILLGILMWSVLLIEEQHYMLSGVLFAVLLNMKHLFAYLAPLYFAFLLKHYVLNNSNTSAGASRDGSNRASSSNSSGNNSSGCTRGQAFGVLKRLLLLGGCVMVVCAVSFGPFMAMGQLKQVLSRLFPFGRGLCHSYWAPNAWALYSFIDKVAAAALTAVGLLKPAATANMAGGIVGVSNYLVLPNIGAGTTAALTLLALVPCLVAVWKAPKQQARHMFAAAVAYANLCGFMFGYHVHEKAALMVEIPMVLAAVRMADWGQNYVLLSTAAHVGMFPLLFKLQELPIRWLLVVAYYMCCLWGLTSIHQGCSHHINKQRWQQQQPAIDAVAQQHADGSQVADGSTDSMQEQSPVGVRTRKQAAAKKGLQQLLQQQQRQINLHTPALNAKADQQATTPSLAECCQWLPVTYRQYLAGLVVLELYCTLAHKHIAGEWLPFVPLLLTSVYCALGISWTWAWMARWFVQRC